MKKMLIVVVSLIVLWPSLGKCEDDDDKKKISTGGAKAIVGYTEAEGIRLSEMGVKTFGIATAPLRGQGPFQVSQSSLVYFQDHVGVYRFKSGAYKLILVQIAGRAGPDQLVKAEGLAAGDVIVTTGAPLLRVAEMQALFGSGEPD